MPFSVDPQELVDGRIEIAKHAKALDRNPAELDITMFAPDGFFRTKNDMTAVADAGADGIVVWLQSSDQSSMLEELSELAGDLF